VHCCSPQKDRFAAAHVGEKITRCLRHGFEGLEVGRGCQDVIPVPSGFMTYNPADLRLQITA